MSTNYGDYIAWRKDGNLQISLITRYMNLNRHTNLDKEDIIFIDNNSYVLAEIEQLVDEGSAILFYKEDVDYNTDIIVDVNNLLTEECDIYEVYGIWVNLIANRINKAIERMSKELEYCEELDALASDLAGVDRGFYGDKDINYELYTEALMKYWKKHLGI